MLSTLMFKGNASCRQIPSTVSHSPVSRWIVPALTVVSLASLGHFAQSGLAQARSQESLQLATRGELSQEVVSTAHFYRHLVHPLNAGVEVEAAGVATAAGDEPSREHATPWTGRMILPQLRRADGGVWFEVYSSPSQPELVGQKVWLTYRDSQDMQLFRAQTTIDMDFRRSQKLYDEKKDSNVFPDRIAGLQADGSYGWQQVSALETLAGARSQAVRLNGSWTVDSMEVVLPDARWHKGQLEIEREPVQMIGREVALLTFVRAADIVDDADADANAVSDTDISVATEIGANDPRPSSKAYRLRGFVAQHWGRTGEGGFSGPTEIVYVQEKDFGEVVTHPDTLGIEADASGINAAGYYAFGERDAAGRFIVRALQPRKLMQVDADLQVQGVTDGKRYLAEENWRRARRNKGHIERVALTGQSQEAWQLSDRALLIHSFGGYGGVQGEKGPVLPLKGQLVFSHAGYSVKKTELDYLYRFFNIPI